MFQQTCAPDIGEVKGVKQVFAFVLFLVLLALVKTARWNNKVNMRMQITPSAVGMQYVGKTNITSKLR
ncbi:hypothetical protein GCM10009347_04080 [Shewanella algicola]|nr:hypothetical protein GCM10009347_04080 [Shewanella algicola]